MRRSVAFTMLALATAAAAAEPELHTVQRNAARGEATRLTTYWSMHLDCRPDVVEVIIVKAPSHGTVELVDAEQVTRFPADSPRAGCNDARIPGKAVEYRPKDDFRGRDVAVIEARYPSGTIRRDTYRIDVLEKMPEVAVTLDQVDAPAAPRREPARPRPAPKAQAGPYDFDCDTPAAARSQWASPSLARTAAVSGSIKLAEARKDAKYLSTATIELVQREGRLAILKFVAYAHKPGKLDAEIAIGSDARSRPREIAVASLDAAQKVSFEARLDGEELEVRVGDVVKRIELPGYEVRRVMLACSGANFLFENVLITD